jgi:hypothetical protein
MVSLKAGVSNRCVHKVIVWVENNHQLAHADATHAELCILGEWQPISKVLMHDHWINKSSVYYERMCILGECALCENSHLAHVDATHAELCFLGEWQPISKVLMHDRDQPVSHHGKIFLISCCTYLLNSYLLV